VSAAIQKVPALIEVVHRLRRDLGTASFVIQDHWDADLSAIGLARPDDHRVLAYVSVYKLPVGEYYVELERPSRGKTSEVVGTWPSVGYAVLCQLLGEHFGVSRASTA
jgi:hypothetical protein